MQEMAARAGRRIEDVSLAWKVRQDRKDNRQQTANLRRKRMTCSPALEDSIQRQDWTARSAMSPSGRFRVTEEFTGRRKIISSGGIRWEIAWGVLIGIAALLLLVLLVQLSRIGTDTRSINRLGAKIEAIADKNDRMNQQLSYLSEDVNVCTEAVKLNLVAADGTRTIWLTAPEYANTFMDDRPAEYAGYGERLAAARGD